MLKKVFAKLVCPVFLILCSLPRSASCCNPFRDIVVSYMKSMANVEWTPEKDFTYWNEKYGKVYKAGMDYVGIPYTQINRDTDLGKFLERLVLKNGKNVYYYDNKEKSYLGCDCSSAVRAAWLLVNPYGTFTDTSDFGSSNGVAAVGPYEFDKEVYTNGSTIDICKKNGQEKMFESYARLQSADAILTHTRTGNNVRFGHVRMVTGIDKEKRLVFTIDQAGVDDKGVLYSKNGKSSWRCETLTFETLYSKGYVPLANVKLLELDNSNGSGSES